jgi:hypothetical protein
MFPLSVPGFGIPGALRRTSLVRFETLQGSPMFPQG